MYRNLNTGTVSQIPSSVPSHSTVWDRQDCPMDTVGFIVHPIPQYHVGQAHGHPYGLPLCLSSNRPSYPTVPCGTGGTVPWTPLCTPRLSQIPSSVLSHSTVWDRQDCPMDTPVFPPTLSDPIVHPILQYRVGQAGLSHGRPCLRSHRPLSRIYNVVFIISNVYILK